LILLAGGFSFLIVLAVLSQLPFMYLHLPVGTSEFHNHTLVSVLEINEARII
jgi:hypothetical protein